MTEWAREVKSIVTLRVHGEAFLQDFEVLTSIKIPGIDYEVRNFLDLDPHLCWTPNDKGAFSPTLPPMIPIHSNKYSPDDTVLPPATSRKASAVWQGWMKKAGMSVIG